MTIEYDRQVYWDVSVDGDGEIEVTSTGGYHGEDATRHFTLVEMRTIVKRAEAHAAGYSAYVASDYEDEDAYWDIAGKYEVE
jgi:hypothetical protein